MKVQYRIILSILIIITTVILLKLLIGTSNIAILNPAGPIASQQFDLMRNMVLIMLVVVIPLFITLFAFAWRYRAENPNLNYSYEPEPSHSILKELALWAIPTIIIVILAILAFNGAKALDPYKPIESATPPLTIQVVALQWKWLFIYPQQHIATVNFVEFPENTPIHFELTADAPMSSFWIPQLGSQIYAMAAMQTQLNLMANKMGEFTGKDTEINGAGYAGMKFIAKSTSKTDFNTWVENIQQTSNILDLPAYNVLAKPSQNNPPMYYSSVQGNLFNNIIMKFMMPASTKSQPTMPQTQMQMPGM